INEPKDVIPKKYLGQQLFNRYAVKNLAEQGKVDLTKLPTYKQMEEIRGGEENHQKFLEDNFQKDGENLFPGFRDPDYKEFNDVDKRTDCWLSDGYNIGISKDGMTHRNSHLNCGFSLRFLKPTK
ncbi:MAG: hypothetical protein WC872_02065, partial [Candidatus Absconditabacterales bacterium]